MFLLFLINILILLLNIWCSLEILLSNLNWITCSNLLIWQTTHCLNIIHHHCIIWLKHSIVVVASSRLYWTKILQWGSTYTHVIHLEHLSIWSSTCIPRLHIKSILMIISLSFDSFLPDHRGFEMTDLFYQFNLLFPVFLPANDIIIACPCL